MSETGGSSFRPGAYRGPQTPGPTMDEKLRDASKAYEKLFLQEMMKAMRSTVHEGGFIKQNSAEKLFRDELDSEYIANWSDRGGVGFADLIYNNMIEKYGVQLGLRAQVTRPKGPLQIDGKSDFAGVGRSSRQLNEMTLRFDRDPAKKDPSAMPLEVTSPWSGRLTKNLRFEEDSHLLEILHDNGLKGQFSFRGSSDRLKLGQPLQAGERIGLLSPDARSFVWTLAPGEPSSAE